jgi:hypothetical protein
MTTPRTLVLAAAVLLLSAPLTGCIAVGYSTHGGWFIWPGSLSLLLILLLVLYATRRR